MWKNKSKGTAKAGQERCQKPEGHGTEGRVQKHAHRGNSPGPHLSTVALRTGGSAACGWPVHCRAFRDIRCQQLHTHTHTHTTIINNVPWRGQNHPQLGTCGINKENPQNYTEMRNRPHLSGFLIHDEGNIVSDNRQNSFKWPVDLIVKGND